MHTFTDEAGGQSHHSGYRLLQADIVSDSGRNDTQQRLAEEVAIALVYNGIAHAVMMASPLDLHDFACGFSLSEGIVSRAADIRSIECHAQARGISLAIEINERAFHALRQRRRMLTGPSGCGLCGQQSLENAVRPVATVSRELQVTLDQVLDGLQELQRRQTLNHATGAVHAATLVHGGGVLVREDVGRHNALDKLIGAMARADIDDGFVLMSSRASYELVHKAAAANIPLLATISAPTDLAVRLADEAGLTLIGFARERRMTVYSHARRVSSPPATD